MVVSLSFSIIYVCTCLSKLIHLRIYMGTVSHTAFIFFLPSVLAPDILVICLSRLLLSRRRTLITYISRLLGCAFSIILLGGTVFYATFYYETGTEVTWTSAHRYANDRDGIKILLSGSQSAFIFLLLILGISWSARELLYQHTGRILDTATTLLWRASEVLDTWNICQRRRDSCSIEDACVSDNLVKSARAHDHPKTRSHTEKGSIYKRVDVRTLLSLLYLVLTAYFRPSTPYAEMSVSLPIKLLQVTSSSTENRVSLHPSISNPWPLPDLIQSKYWERPKGYFKGWAPGDDSILGQIYRDRVPTWLPETPPDGFYKWVSSNGSNTGDEQVGNDVEPGHIYNKAEVNGMFYNPVGDPLKITNQDEQILETLRHAFKAGKVRIKHIALIMMESTREELFPLQQGSDIHRNILQSHKGQKDEDDVNTILSRLTPVAEKITGKPVCWRRSNGTKLPEVPIPEWNDTTQDGFGGINVVGGFTTASLSFKSLAATYCGVWPIPIDNFEESEAQSYQPCIPQILHLFNQVKENKTSSNDLLEQEWLTAFFQSVTEKYDRQDVFTKKMGIEKTVAKDYLERNAKVRSDLEEINYFGYPETTLKTHIRELIEKVQQENKRMFFSHFTSTTHHPWGLPGNFKKTEYLNTQGKMSWHKDFNNYLNTVRFTDAWLGELLHLFDHHGIANETLVVLVGDHGQAFREDISTRTGTYKNSHVSNFRVPITFRHPHIPRVQYEANATSISILPTILDLLINTGSLNSKDTVVASDLIHDYEGQSLIRPYKPAQNGRRAWNFGIINSGASMLSVTSADTPWRLVIPLDRASRWRFTDLKNDQLELEPLERWSVEQLAGDVRTIHGEEASLWIAEADAVAKWWVRERKRLWGYKTKT